MNRQNPMRPALSRLVLLALLASAPLFAQESRYGTQIQAFERFAEREMAADKMPALSVAFAKGDFVWARGFGWADLENRVSATEKSSYRMASVTKPMTAVAALRLAEMGKLDLDAEVQTYVPYFPRKSKPVTVRQLLAHLGGISHYRDYSVEGRIREPKTTREAIGIFEKFDLVKEPGAEYSYSSYGYNLLGAAIEGAAGKPYAEVMQELVWGPAGMSDTRMDDPHAIIPNRVQGYRLDGSELKRSEYVNISSRFAAGGTRSTVVDLIRFVHALRDGKLLRDETKDAMWWLSETTARRWSSYGLGWSVFSVNGHFVVNHSGSQEETRTLLIYFPREDLAMAFASNFEDADFRFYRNRLYELLSGEVWSPPAYLADGADALAFEAARQAFDAGSLDDDKRRKARAADRAALEGAFASLNRAVSGFARDPSGSKKAIEEGIHPVQGQPLVLVGSWIASKVLTNGDGTSKSRIHREGPLAFFGEYIRLYRRDPAIPRSLRFEPRFERRLLALESAWARAWTADARELFLGSLHDERTARALAPFRGARIAPNLASPLVAQAESSFQKGDAARTGRLARLAAEIYPDDHAAAGIYGVSLALSGQTAESEKWLRRSIRARPDGYASARRLLSIAREVSEGAGKPPAIALLETAVRVHPTSEELKKALEELRSSPPAS